MSDKIQTIDFLSPNAGKQFVDSLHHTGFAILHNHQIDFNLINDVYNDWETFFAVKKNIPIHLILIHKMDIFLIAVKMQRGIMLKI